MSDYWKSLPKKYCDFCNCWISDNKASRDSHERGSRHQSNIRKRVKDIQRNGKTKDLEAQAYRNELLKIEAAALSSFQEDTARNPALLSEFATTKSLVPDRVAKSSETSLVKPNTFNRFGQSYADGESETLVHGKKRALETIAKVFEKKSKWLEAKTSEGKTYYWNKDNLETKFDAPKSGFLSLAEQAQLKSNSTQSTSGDAEPIARADAYGGWRRVERDTTGKMVDLQLPDQDVSQIVLDLHQTNTEGSTESGEATTQQRETFQFKEKTIEKSIVSKNEKPSLCFKKSSTKRNIRARTNE